MIENLQKSPQNDEILENVNKLLFLLEQIQTDIRSLSQLKSTASFSEINSKLDNLLKLLSTLLQQ
jgi:archaellum component FlaC